MEFNFLSDSQNGVPCFMKLTPKQADAYHDLVQRLIDAQVKAKMPVEPVLYEALEQDFYILWRETIFKPKEPPQAMKIDYEKYIRSPEWKMRSAAAKERAGGKCQICGTKKKLNTHHNTYDRLGHELDIDLVVLCEDCHELFHAQLGLKR